MAHKSLFQLLCARPALSLTSVVVNFGTQIAFFSFCVPVRLRLSRRSWSTLAHKSLFSGFVCQAGAVSNVDRGQLWHTNRFFQVLCARRALSPESLKGKNEKFLAHKSPKLKIVCHSFSITQKKREIPGTQIAKNPFRVPHIIQSPQKMRNLCRLFPVILRVPLSKRP